MRIRKTFRPVMLVLVLSGPALGWWGAGHDLATRTAVIAAADELPRFFSDGVATIAHCSLDPDAFTRPIGPAELHRQESPEHYFDLELLAGEPIPPDRYAFIALCAGKGLKPNQVGFVPYAVTEWTQRLSVALAEHRRWPDDPHIRRKCLVYAGILSHYAQDLCQPLHITIHWDGRARPDGTSPRSGIHAKVDALLGKLAVRPEQVASRLEPAPFAALLPAVFRQIRASNALVECVYATEAHLPDIDAPLEAGSPAERFALERLKACAAFTASCYLTAWQDSAKIELPDWHVAVREKLADVREADREAQPAAE